MDHRLEGIVGIHEALDLRAFRYLGHPPRLALVAAGRAAHELIATRHVLPALEAVAVERLDAVGRAVVAGMRAHAARQDLARHGDPRARFDDLPGGPDEERDQHAEAEKKEGPEEDRHADHRPEGFLLVGRAGGEDGRRVRSALDPAEAAVHHVERAHPDGHEEQRQEDPESAPEVGAPQIRAPGLARVQDAGDALARRVAGGEAMDVGGAARLRAGVPVAVAGVRLAAVVVAVPDLQGESAVESIDDRGRLDGAGRLLPGPGVDSLQPVDRDHHGDQTGEGGEEPQTDRRAPPPPPSGRALAGAADRLVVARLQGIRLYRLACHPISCCRG